ncbi:MAG: methyltransferase domain-containing protein [Thermoleophilia bacterium]|nr:methyltransferase domain-containing protein [Thermoleophilia bacterium]
MEDLSKMENSGSLEEMSMEVMSDEQLKRELSFDLYGRYAIIRDIIEFNRAGQKKLRILDVGGRGNLLKKFLPGDDVSYLDPLVDTDDENYIEGDGCDIPLEDDSFDYVVSSDVFEHIEPSRRDQFLTENLRVAKSGVILGAIFHSPEREMAEKFANESYRYISRGQDHFWLKEHIDNGLPEAGALEDLLGKKGHAFQKIPNNDLRLWEYLLCSTFVLLAAGKIEKIKDFNEFYNGRVYPHDHGEGSYRTIYFIRKAEDLKELELGEGGIDDGLYLEAIRNTTSLLYDVYLEDKDQFEALKNEFQEKVNQIVRKNDQIIETEAALAVAKGEVAGLKASFSWRITGPLRTVRAKAGKISAGKSRKS